MSTEMHEKLLDGNSQHGGTSSVRSDSNMSDIPHSSGFHFFHWGRELESIGTNHHFTEEEKIRLKAHGSVDYFPQNSEMYKHYLNDMEYSPSNKNRYKWSIMGLIGFSVGMTGFLLKSFIEYTTESKFEFVSEFIEKRDFEVAFIVLAIICLFMVLFSSAIVVFIEPHAGASGVPGKVIHHPSPLPASIIQCLDF